VIFDQMIFSWNQFVDKRIKNQDKILDERKGNRDKKYQILEVLDS